MPNREACDTTSTGCNAQDAIRLIILIKKNNRAPHSCSWSAYMTCNFLETYPSWLLHSNRDDCVTRPFIRSAAPSRMQWLRPIPSAFAVMAPANVRQRRRVRHTCRHLLRNLAQPPRTTYNTATHQAFVSDIGRIRKTANTMRKCSLWAYESLLRLRNLPSNIHTWLRRPCHTPQKSNQHGRSR